MKPLLNHINIVFAGLLMAGAAQAAFVVERESDGDAAPAVVSATPSSRKPVATSSAQSPAGRNVDLSAKVGSMSKMNRQRIDLESKVTSRITQSGSPPGELEVLRGMGRDVTLGDALRQMLPAGWSAYSDQDLPDGTVDWDGNRTWPMALHSVLARYDMRAHLDWESQELMLFVPSPKQFETAAAAGASAAPAAGTPPPPPVPAKQPVWTLSTEKTLRENLRSWASSVDWNLVWSATYGDTVVDYPVDAKVDFAGDLLGTTGAMAKVIAAYSDADRPLEIEFFKGNKVVEVRLHRIPDTRADSGSRELPARVQLPPPPPTPVYVPVADPALL
jgi:hypothetical protein